MRVLSLFDGISCGKLALDRAGIPVSAYYTSEIDKYARAVSQYHYPDQRRLGDVRAWKDWSIGEFDLIMGGSPCQGFSTAGKGLNFDDPRSKLFFTFVEILDKYKPKYFLLENVVMKQEWQDIITSYLGVSPIMINSQLVSAQHRKRLYWTNIPGVTQPEDRGILLRDIVLSDGALSHVTGSVRGRRKDEHGVRKDYSDYPVVQYVELREDEKTNTLSTVQKDNIVIDVEALVHSDKAKEFMDRKTKDGRTHWDFAHHSDVLKDKSAAVIANFFKDWNCIRKFHPIECERLQTLPDNWTAVGVMDTYPHMVEISNTQRYKMIGNAWTVDVIAYIFSGLKE